MLLSHPFVLLNIDDNVGQLILTPCPGTKAVGSYDSIRQLASANAVAILTLLPIDEMHEYGVLDLPTLCAQLGLLWFHLPIEDDQVPGQDFNDGWSIAGRRIHELLSDGKNIAIHCRVGSSRTGLVAAQILLERGVPHDEVINRVRAVRPNALQVPAHQVYINNLFQQVAIK